VSSIEVEHCSATVGIHPFPRGSHGVGWFAFEMDRELGQIVSEFKYRESDSKPKRRVSQFLRISVLGRDERSQLQEILSLAADRLDGDSPKVINSVTLGKGPQEWDISLDVDFAEEGEDTLTLDLDSGEEGAFAIELDKAEEISEDDLAEEKRCDKVIFHFETSQLSVVRNVLNFASKTLSLFDELAQSDD
jgi:hypothetical protein